MLLLGTRGKREETYLLQALGTVGTSMWIQSFVNFDTLHREPRRMLDDQTGQRFPACVQKRHGAE